MMRPPIGPSQSLPRVASREAPLAGLRFGCAVFACGVIFLGWCLIAAVIRPWLPASRRARIGRRRIHRGFAVYVKLLEWLGVVQIDLRELEAVGDEAGVIFVANHPTMMDVVLVISRLDNVCCIMKSALQDNAFLGAGARLAGYIPNDSARAMIRQATETLREGARMLIFPEATRSERHPVNPLTGGFALIAKQAGAPVQTLIIETDTPFLRKGWSIFRRPPMPMRFRIRLGRRFEPGLEPGVLIAAVEREFHDQLK